MVIPILNTCSPVKPLAAQTWPDHWSWLGGVIKRLTYIINYYLSLNIVQKLWNLTVCWTSQSVCFKHTKLQTKAYETKVCLNYVNDLIINNKFATCKENFLFGQRTDYLLRCLAKEFFFSILKDIFTCNLYLLMPRT